MREIVRSELSEAELSSPPEYPPEVQPSANLQQTTTLILLAVFFLFGMLLGALFIRKSDPSLLDALDQFCFTSISTRVNGSYWQLFLSSMASSFLFTLASFFNGLTMWGMFLTPLLPLLRGFGLGLTAGYLYGFGGIGIWYFICIVLPGAFLSALTVLLTSTEAIRFSKRLNRAHKVRNRRYAFAPQPAISSFLLRIGVFGCLSIVASFLDMGAVACFGGFFQNTFG